MMTIEERYAAGMKTCRPDEVNFKPNIELEELHEYFNARKAKHLIMRRFNTQFLVECLLSGYDTNGCDNEYSVSFELIAKNEEDAVKELQNYGLYEYYLARFNEDGQLAW